MTTEITIPATENTDPIPHETGEPTDPTAPTQTRAGETDYGGWDHTKVVQIGNDAALLRRPGRAVYVRVAIDEMSDAAHAVLGKLHRAGLAVPGHLTADALSLNAGEREQLGKLVKAGLVDGIKPPADESPTFRLNQYGRLAVIRKSREG